MSLFCRMQNRLTLPIIVVLLGFCATQVSAQVYRLRYEATHFETIASIVQFRVVTERISADSLNFAMYEYRFDRKGEDGALRDSASLGRSDFGLKQFSADSLDSYREKLLNSPTAKVLKDNQIEYLGKVDTVAGLPSYLYAITIESVRQYLVWLAEAPPGLENLVLLQTMEYQRRKTSFLVEEELCNMIRLVLLRGLAFPPDSSGRARPFIITRYDTAVNIDFLTVRNNTYLYDLKSLTRETPAGN